jgi:hypothetical protein
MRKPMFALIVLAIALFGTQCWAAAKTSSSPAVSSAAPQEFTFCGGEEQPPCVIPNPFTPGLNGTTRGVYDFGVNGLLIVDFVTVLRPFTLTVTTQFPAAPNLDPNVFPNTTCFHYQSSGQCTQYDFTGNVQGRPNRLPKKGQDYQGLITLTLIYNSSDPALDPAFGHAPGESIIFSEDILTSYSTIPVSSDPTMDGTTPGLSSVIALNKRLEESDCFVFVSPKDDSQTFTAGEEIEVEFQLFHSFPCSAGDPNPLRDKDARLSLFTRDSNGLPVFVRVGKDMGGKHFHFDHEEGVNEREVDTEGLQPGTYFITVFSDEFPPQTRKVVIQ